MALPVIAHAESFHYSFPEEKGVKHITALLFDSGKVVSVTPEQIQGEETSYSYSSVADEPGLSIAFAITPGGELLTNAVQNSEDVSRLNKNLPICDTRLSLSNENYKQGELFASLIELRQKRKLHIESKISSILSGEMLQKLRRLEENFGFRHEKPLGPELSTGELVTRLDALTHAIKLYKTYKSQR